MKGKFQVCPLDGIWQPALIVQAARTVQPLRGIGLGFLCSTLRVYSFSEATDPICPSLTVLVMKMDVRDMSNFRSGSFDAVFDKGP